MAKEKFKNTKLTGDIKINLGDKIWIGDKSIISNAIIDVCKEYSNNGDILTLRQLYYQLVSKDLIPNHDKVYKKIGDIKDDLVYSGVVDWHVFEDRGRVPHIAYFGLKMRPFFLLFFILVRIFKIFIFLLNTSSKWS